jgi:hypothetical protein
MSPSSTQAYLSLLNDRVLWKRQAFGHQDNRAIAFLPESGHPNPEEAVRKAVNLFVNHDPRPRRWTLLDDGTKIQGEYPAPPQACHYHDFTYINMTDERLHATLVNYFVSSLPRELGKMVEIDCGEEGPDLEWTCDEAEVEALAQEAALHFITHQIKDDGFMSYERTYAPVTYGTAFSRPEPSDLVERVADAASA